MPKVHPKPDTGHVSDYIRKTFEKRECCRLRLKTNQNDSDFCECGYSKRVHSNEALSSSTNSMEALTKTSPTDAFGKMDIVEMERRRRFCKSKGIRYLRLEHSTNTENILTLFKKYWKLPDPNLVLSVVSDSQYSTIRQNEEMDANSEGEFRKEIVKSLVQAAASTNAWIITGGIDGGVDQLVGDELKRISDDKSKTPNVVLGISNWGCLADKKQFFKTDEYGLANYSSDVNKNGLSLSEHNTHFLLVDDGRQNHPGCEFNLRMEVEYALKRKESKKEGAEFPMSLVYVIIEGSVDAIQAVERALANGIPVIIAKGSGGAADAIANLKDPTVKELPSITNLFIDIMLPRLEELLIIANISHENTKQMIDSIEQESKGRIAQIEKSLNENRISKETFLKEIAPLRVAKKLNDELATLRRTPKTNRQAEINEESTADSNPTADQLKERFNKSQEAVRKRLKSIIRYLDTEQNTSEDTEPPTQNVTPDVTRNSVDEVLAIIHEVLLLMELPHEVATRLIDELKQVHIDLQTIHGDLRTIESTQRSNSTKENLIIFDIELNDGEKNTIDQCILEALRKVNRNNPSYIFLLAADWDNEDFFKKLQMQAPETHDLESILLNLMKKDKHKYVKLLLEHDVNLKNCIRKCPDIQTETFERYEQMAYLMKQIKVSDEISPSTNAGDDKHILAKVLFIWCVNRLSQEMAVSFMDQGENYLAMALIGYEISKCLMKSSKNVETTEKVKEQKRFFSKIAFEFLRICYADDRSNTHQMLVGQVEDLDGRTPLQIAVNADFKKFVAEDAVQTLLNKIWIKDIIDHDKHLYMSLLVSAFCPLVAPTLFSFKEPDYDSEDEDECEETRKSREFAGTFWGKIKSFVNAPTIKFYYGFASYFGYLILFSIVMLTDFRARVTPSEIALMIWTFVLFIEELMQHYNDRHEYKNQWNWFDYGGFATFLIGFIVRMIYHCSPASCPECLYVARIILTLSLIIFFIRILQLLCINKKLCPKIYMIRGLMGDLVVFLLILAVFISAYGVASNAILYPNQPLNAKLLRDVFYDAWWSVIQQFNRDDTLGENCNMDNPSTSISIEYCSSTTDPNVDYIACKEKRCPANTWIVSVLLAFYALFTVIMMLNVLIAMFNITFSDINEQQLEVSKMQRYRLIREYSCRSMIPLPLCAITYPFRLVRNMLKIGRHCCGSDEEDDEQKKNGQKNENAKDSGRRRKKIPTLKRRPPKAFGKKLRGSVRDWEQKMQEKYEEGKDDEYTRLFNRIDGDSKKDDKLLRACQMVVDELLVIKVLQSLKSEEIHAAEEMRVIRG